MTSSTLTSILGRGPQGFDREVGPGVTAPAYSKQHIIQRIITLLAPSQATVHNATPWKSMFDNLEVSPARMLALNVEQTYENIHQQALRSTRSSHGCSDSPCVSAICLEPETGIIYVFFSTNLLLSPGQSRRGSQSRGHFVLVHRLIYYCSVFMIQTQRILV